jgi:hypothetical protein
MEYQKMKGFWVMLWTFIGLLGQAQNTPSDNAVLLKLLLNRFYAQEKPIVKNRLQLLYFYRDKAPNTLEMWDGCRNHPILQSQLEAIKKQVQTPKAPETWEAEFSILFAKENQYLKQKVQQPVTLEQFEKDTQRFGENNQRMMIVNEPIYLEQGYCLIKVGFYRSIEHNSGSFFLFQKKGDTWQFVDEFNRWET